jgi:hypothetical protein
MKNNLLSSILYGAVAAGALTYLFATEDGAEVRQNLDDVRGTFPGSIRTFTAFQDKIKDQLSWLLR